MTALLAARAGAGDDDLQAEIIAIAWVFTGLAMLTVFLKLFTRASIHRLMGWDDFFIFLSLALSVVAAALVHHSVNLGLGRHTDDVLAEFGPQRLVATARWQMLGYPFNILAFSLPNISIGILVTNLLDPNPWRTRGLMAMVLLQVFFAGVVIVVLFVQCDPLQKLWDKGMEGQCWSPSILNGLTYFLGAYTALTDAVLAFVPISAFYKLQMRRSTKVGVSVLMGMTLLSAIVTIVKTRYIDLFNDTEDPLYNPVVLVNWGLVEQNVVIVAACVPTLRPFFHRAFKGEKLSYERSGGTGDRATSGSKGVSGSRTLAYASKDRDYADPNHVTTISAVDDHDLDHGNIGSSGGSGNSSTRRLGAVVPLDDLPRVQRHPYDELPDEASSGGGRGGSHQDVQRQQQQQQQQQHQDSRNNSLRIKRASKKGATGAGTTQEQQQQQNCIWRTVDVSLEFEDDAEEDDDVSDEIEWVNGQQRRRRRRQHARGRPSDPKGIVPMSLVEDPGYRERER